MAPQDRRLAELHEEARREEKSINDGAERSFRTLGVERPRKYECAVDDLIGFLEDEPDLVALALARRALECADNPAVPSGARANMCWMTGWMVAERLPAERDLVVGLLRRALALDPTLALAGREPKLHPSAGASAPAAVPRPRRSGRP